jgi:hypothetical protein
MRCVLARRGEDQASAVTTSWVPVHDKALTFSELVLPLLATAVRNEAELTLPVVGLTRKSDRPSHTRLNSCLCLQCSAVERQADPDG